MWKLTAVATAALASFAVAALAATPTEGPWSGGKQSDSKPDVDFSVTKKNGKVKVDGFTLRDFGFSCSGGGGGGQKATNPTSPVKVKNSKFDTDQTSNGQRVKLTGTFLSKTKAKGTIKWTSDVGGDRCTTGKLNWRAARQ